MVIIELEGPPLFATCSVDSPSSLSSSSVIQNSHGKLLRRLCYDPICASADGDAGAGASGSTVDDSRSSAIPT